LGGAGVECFRAFFFGGDCITFPELGGRFKNCLPEVDGLSTSWPCITGLATGVTGIDGVAGVANFETFFFLPWFLLFIIM
jgi:hypothetical protein